MHPSCNPTFFYLGQDGKLAKVYRQFCVGETCYYRLRLLSLSPQLFRVYAIVDFGTIWGHDCPFDRNTKQTYDELLNTSYIQEGVCRSAPTQSKCRSNGREQLEGLVGVNPVEVRVLSAALFFMLFLKAASFDSGACSLPWWHFGGTVGFGVLPKI